MNVARSVLGLVLLASLPERGRSYGVALAAALWAPIVGLALAGVLGAASIHRRLRRQRVAAARSAAELTTFGELLGIGLSSGMSIAEALGFAGERLTSELASEVATVTRGMVRTGAAGLMASSGGTGGRLYLLVGRAMATGAPVLGAVETFVAEQRAEERSAREAALRRLPVVLLFPLALLILPGFVLLTVAPAMSGALTRLGL